MALAGGVSHINSPMSHSQLARAGFISPKGASTAFDADASGYCRGEGAGVVILKKVEMALKDDDKIEAVIASSALNQSDSDGPITVPSTPSQVSLYNKVIQRSNIEPSDVGYVEAHGTGTPVADPLEMESIRRVFGGSRRTTKLFVGRVKSNIGHLESASGAAALIKAILILQKKTIPGQIGLRSLNPKMRYMEENRMSIALSNEPMKNPAILVANYGAAGSNAALIIRNINNGAKSSVDAYSRPSPGTLEGHCVPFILTANSQSSLEKNVASLMDWLAQPGHANLHLESLAYNLCHHIDISLSHALVFTAANPSQLQDRLIHSQVASCAQTSAEISPVISCFGGQIPDFIGLNEKFYVQCPVFKQHLDDVDQASQGLRGPTLFPKIFSQTPIKDICQLHCMLFGVQYASVQSWIDCGAVIATLIGYSLGQLTA